MPASPNSPAPLHVMLDARYLREKPSGIGSYVQALVERVPALAPDDRFTLWAHRRAAAGPGAQPDHAPGRPGPTGAAAAKVLSRARAAGRRRCRRSRR